MLANITPVVLTYNEEANIARTVSCLSWARDIVIVDSGSTDRTVAIAREFPQVRLFDRRFRSHAEQWLFAVTETKIETKWLLRLDADYQVPDELVQEMAKLDPDAPVDAYRIGFDYAVYGHRLIASLYPAKVVLMRPGRFTLLDGGHTEKCLVHGPVHNLHSRILHDDWKPLEGWTASQGKYMTKEAQFITLENGSVPNWLRRHPPLMPMVMLVYCLFGKGLILNGWAGLLYALQRTVAEAILSLIILEKRLKPK